MASVTNATQRKESVKDSNESFSIAGPSAVQKAQNGTSTSPASCSALPEPPREISFERELFENPFGAYSTTTSFVPAIPGNTSIHSFDMGDDVQSFEEPQTDERRIHSFDMADNVQSFEELQRAERRIERCSAFVNFYSNSLIRIRNSRFFYVFQSLIALLPLSTIVMGIQFSKTCKTDTSFPVLTAIIAVLGLIFMGLWISINGYHHRGRPCTGQQKFLIRFFLSFLAILLSIELYLFYSMSPSFDPDAYNYCDEMFYYYTQYKYIVLGGIIAVVALLYFPGFPRFICSLQCSRSPAPAPAPSYQSLT